MRFEVKSWIRIHIETNQCGFKTLPYVSACGVCSWVRIWVRLLSWDCKWLKRKHLKMGTKQHLLGSFDDFLFPHDSKRIRNRHCIWFNKTSFNNYSNRTSFDKNDFQIRSGSNMSTSSSDPDSLNSDPDPDIYWMRNRFQVRYLLNPAPDRDFMT